VPVIDASRQALLLTAEELQAAEQLRDRPIELDGWPAELLEVVARPAYRLFIERFVAEHLCIEQAWAAPGGRAVWGAAIDGGVELTPIVPATLPFQVMRVVGLGAAPHGPRPVLGASVAQLDEASLALAAGDDERARAALDGDEGLLALLRERRVTWRASAVWTDEAGERQERTTRVADAGPLGLYRVEARDGRLTFVPIAPSEAWESICELFPAPEGAGV
jgi:hypothetical protein